MIIDKIGEGHYQTRSGLPVVIYTTNEGKDYPVKGYVIKKDGTKKYFSWTKEGIFHTAKDHDDLDLIPVAQPLPESKQQRPVDVGIPYSNEAERKAAIKQAESYGYKEWDGNKRHRSETDNYIWLHKDGDWFDAKLDEGNKTIPLDRSFMEQPEVKQPKYFDIPGHGKVFNHLIENYSMVEQNNGTITLTPIDKDYQANYEKALQFLDKTPENVMWPHSDLAKILVEFLNSVNHAD